MTKWIESLAERDRVRAEKGPLFRVFREKGS